METIKTCACGFQGPPSEFHRSHKAKCIPCGRKAHAAYMLEYKARDIEGYNAKRRARHQANPETNRVALRRWHAENPGANAAHCKTFKERHPATARASKATNHARRKCRRNGNPGDFTTKEFLDLCERTGNTCLRCGGSINLSPDHIVPISVGGSNTIDNIQPLCKSCNSVKGTQTIDYRPQAQTAGSI